MSAWKKQDIFKLAIAVGLIAAFLILFIPFFAEVALAAVFAFAIEPGLGRFLQSKHLRWKASVAGILFGMFLVVAAPITMVAYKAYGFFAGITQSGFQKTELFQTLAQVRTQLLKSSDQILSGLHLEHQIDLAGLSELALNRFGSIVVEISTRFLYRIPDLLLSVFVFCVALYFFLAEGRLAKAAFLRMQFLTRSEAEKLIRVLQKASYNTVVTSISLGLIAALMVSLGAVFLHGGDFLVVFVITFFLAFVPVIGGGPVALTLGLYKLLAGSYGEAIGFLVVAILVGIVDNGLRPYLISSNEEDLPPAVGLLALIGALLIFGMPGIFLGPVIASLAIRVVPILYPNPSPPSTAVSGPSKR